MEEQDIFDSEEDVDDPDFIVQKAEQSDMDVDDADKQKARPSSKKTKQIGRPSTSLRAYIGAKYHLNLEVGVPVSRIGSLCICQKTLQKTFLP